ncbi:MAG: response regulator, partial [Chitinophagaceae bacterium]|nr:response regulator [Chitinophagaceae bacterium]
MLIVDDEELIRNGIFQTGHWQQHEIEVIGLASDGIHALEFIREIKPDIVLTDIVMPNMDGIQLIKTLKEQYPEIKVIILSGFDEFQYAKSAIEYKVHHYLLKPAKIEVILDEVLKLKNQIQREQEKVSRDELVRKKLKESFPLLREQFLNRLVQGKTEVPENIASNFKYLEIDLSLSRLCVMVLQIDNLPSVQSHCHEASYAD